MEKIRRKIRLFFVFYGRFLFTIIGIILLLILGVQTLNNITIEQKKKNTPTVEEKIEINRQEKIKEEEKEYISRFIEYCNKNQIQEAYNMLSVKCKQENYKDIKEFKEKYINKVHSIPICNYQIVENNELYQAILIQDMLITGKSDSIIKENYKIERTALELKIYIYN